MLVIVTATSEEIRGAMRVRLNASYVDALEGAGLVPLIVPPLADPATALRALASADGLVLTGGEDIAPSRYGAEPHPLTGAPNESRDATELTLARAARERRMPTLAICRGVQLLNVALGGTLVQDIESASPRALDHERGAVRRERTHPIEIVAGTRLASVVRDATPSVNSIHHQALDRVAPPLRVSARASDGTIEAVESADADWWAIGVQWHPEELIRDPHSWDRDLFAAFSAAMRRA